MTDRQVQLLADAAPSQLGKDLVKVSDSIAQQLSYKILTAPISMFGGSIIADKAVSKGLSAAEAAKTAGKFSGGVYTGGMALSSAADKYVQCRSEGQGKLEASVRALGTGAISYFTESLGGIGGSKSPLNGLEEKCAESIIGSILYNAFEEGGEEFLEYSADILLDGAVDLAARGEWQQEWDWAEVIENAKIGAMTGGLFGGYQKLGDIKEAIYRKIDAKKAAKLEKVAREYSDYMKNAYRLMNDPNLRSIAERQIGDTTIPAATRMKRSETGEMNFGDVLPKKAGEVSFEQMYGTKPPDGTENQSFEEWAAGKDAEKKKAAEGAANAVAENNKNSANRRNVDYKNEEERNSIQREAHDRMISEGKAVDITQSVKEKGESFPDLRSMKKSERLPIIKRKMAELKNTLREQLSKLKVSSFEFDINGNTIEARLYDTGIREVLEKLTQEKAGMLSLSKEIFENSEYLYSTQDKSGDTNIEAWDYFYVPIKIGDETAGVRIAVRTVSNPKESQIYNWSIKKDTSLGGVRHTPFGSNPNGTSSDVSVKTIPQNGNAVNASSEKSSIETQSLEEYLGERGLSSPVSNYNIDKTRIPHGETQRQRDARIKAGMKAENEYSEKRRAAIEEYNAKVEKGEIRVPSAIEKTIKKAQGYLDNPSVAAARRMAEKRGYDWISGEKLDAERQVYTLSYLDENGKELSETFTTRGEAEERAATLSENAGYDTKALVTATMTKNAAQTQQSSENAVNASDTKSVRNAESKVTLNVEKSTEEDGYTYDNISIMLDGKEVGTIGMDANKRRPPSGSQSAQTANTRAQEPSDNISSNDSITDTSENFKSKSENSAAKAQQAETEEEARLRTLYESEPTGKYEGTEAGESKAELDSAVEEAKQNAVTDEQLKEKPEGEKQKILRRRIEKAGLDMTVEEIVGFAQGLGRIKGFFGSERKDFARIFDDVSEGSRTIRNDLHKLLEVPHRQAQAQYTESYKNAVKAISDKFAKLGIKAGSKESAAVQRIGEHAYQIDSKGNTAEYTEEMLKRDFPDSWEKIAEAAKFTRDIYDDYLKNLNEMYEKIYPNTLEKAEAYKNKVREKSVREFKKAGQLGKYARGLETNLMCGLF